MGTQTVITNDPEVLAERLACVDGLIAFDGPPGSGKSYLAAAMADRLGCHHVDGDDHIDKKRSVYVPALRLDDLHAKIMAGFGASPRVLLHCVCAREVVARLGLVAKAYIYVQRVSAIGVPGNPDMLAAEETGESLGIPGESDLTRELLKYHAGYKPAVSADILYRRTIA